MNKKALIIGVVALAVAGGAIAQKSTARSIGEAVAQFLSHKNTTERLKLAGIEAKDILTNTAKVDLSKQTATQVDYVSKTTDALMQISAAKSLNSSKLKAAIEKGGERAILAESILALDSITKGVLDPQSKATATDVARAKELSSLVEKSLEFLENSNAIADASSNAGKTVEKHIAVLNDALIGVRSSSKTIEEWTTEEIQSWIEPTRKIADALKIGNEKAVEEAYGNKREAVEKCNRG